jgi:hypothetical protein
VKKEFDHWLPNGNQNAVFRLDLGAGLKAPARGPGPRDSSVFTGSRGPNFGCDRGNP